MDILSQKTLEITQNITNVDQQLVEKKQKVQKLSNSQNTIKKLNFMFELSKKIQSNINHDQMAKAIIFSARAKTLLNKYSHLSAFQKIEEECNVISKEITLNIMRKLKNETVRLWVLML